jgi:hypothetical protein
MRTLHRERAETGRTGKLDAGFDVMRQCLTWLPKERLTAEQCRKHSFCAEQGIIAGQDPGKAACNPVSSAGAEPRPELSLATSTGTGSCQPLRRFDSSARAEQLPGLTPATGTGTGTCQPLCFAARSASAAHRPGLTLATGTGTGTCQPLRKSASSASTEPPPGLTRASGTGTSTRPVLTPVSIGQRTRRSVDGMVKSQGCNCVGHCPGGHRIGVPCTEPPSVSTPPGRAPMCDSCRCSSPNCHGAKSRSSYCWHHAYQSLGIEFRVIRHLHEAQILQQMMPLDIQAFLSARPMFKKDVALELICAWVKEPPAIEALMALRPTSTCYTGAQLITSLKQVCGP